MTAIILQGYPEQRKISLRIGYSIKYQGVNYAWLEPLWAPFAPKIALPWQCQGR